MVVVEGIIPDTLPNPCNHQRIIRLIALRVTCASCVASSPLERIEVRSVRVRRRFHLNPDEETCQGFLWKEENDEYRKGIMKEAKVFIVPPHSRLYS